MSAEIALDVVIVVLGVISIYFYYSAMKLSSRVLFWQIKWIELEHESAEREHRRPRDISEVKGEP